MARPRLYRDMTMVTCRLDDDLLDELDRVSEKMNLSRSAALRTILEFCLEGLKQGNLDISVGTTVICAPNPAKKPRRKS